MNIAGGPICCWCKHLREGVPFRCAAYPDGIPSAILRNEADHREPYEGDNGTRFEVRGDVPADIFDVFEAEETAPPEDE